LLARGGIGRIALNVRALPAIFPVRFALSDDRIVLRVVVDSTLDRAARGAVVAFEADGADGDGDWSVALTGVARELVEAFDLNRAVSLTLPHWSPHENRFVAIPTDYISGRRVPSS
jgi:uncharacterized protein